MSVRDDIQSVTLKAFRKIVGYDTFDSIRKKDRDEAKDPADYYNVTVNLLIRRTPPPKGVAQPLKIDGVPLKRALDKGFPYDDADINREEWAKPHR